MVNYSTKYRSLLPKLTLVTLIGLSMPAQAGWFENFCGNAQSTFQSAKKTIDDSAAKANSYYNTYKTVKTWGKRAAYLATAVAGYKTFIKPASRLFFGKTAMPLIKTIDMGINLSLVAGCIVGSLYIYDKYFVQKRFSKIHRQTKNQINDLEKQNNEHQDNNQKNFDKLGGQLKDQGRAIRRTERVSNNIFSFLKSKIFGQKLEETVENS